MTSPDESAALVTRLETVLKRLEVGNTEFPGACAACLQDVTVAGVKAHSTTGQKMGEGAYLNAGSHHRPIRALVRLTLQKRLLIST